MNTTLSLKIKRKLLMNRIKQIAYKKGYKYQLVEIYCSHTPIKPVENIKTKYIDLDVTGYLVIRDGYAWDGPSGPTIDSEDFMRGSLEHDALYQLMRMGLLDREIYRIQADKLLKQSCKNDGMFSIRAQIVYIVLRLFGESSSKQKNAKKNYRVPKLIV